MRIKIYGAGSIGNHLAHASRTLGWDVTVCDVSADALHRMRTQIYPGRYGQWDDAIRLLHNDEAPSGGFDVIFIGTPPEAHLPLALGALEEGPRALIVEKPLCTPSLDLAQELFTRSRQSDTRVFVGYDHVVGRAAEIVEELLREGAVGRVQTLDVEFREHWSGIFAAHPWLDGPADSYLGYWTRGGGASGEHSHAINLWQHFAHVLGGGKVSEVDARLRYVEQGAANYDDLCLMTLRTEQGLVGRVVQDVVTVPPRKWAVLQGEQGRIEWLCNFDATGDAVAIRRPGQAEEIIPVPKRRPDDFIRELEHITRHLESGAPSGLDLERGLDTMLVIAAAHASERSRGRVGIDYAKGYTLDALQSRGAEVMVEEPGAHL